MPVLYIVACGGYVAGQLEPLIGSSQRAGWDVCVIASPSAVPFMDRDQLEALTGHVVRSEFRKPGEPDPIPAGDAIVVVPATFNTINKWAHGSSDTVALGILNEAVGAGLPIVAVPTPNAALAGHPAFLASVATLRSWGVRVLFDPQRFPPPRPGTGRTATDFLPWQALDDAIAELRATVTGRSGTVLQGNRPSRWPGSGRSSLTWARR
jgi:hypothetical protein